MSSTFSKKPRGPTGIPPTLTTSNFDDMPSIVYFIATLL